MAKFSILDASLSMNSATCGYRPSFHEHTAQRRHATTRQNMPGGLIGACHGMSLTLQARALIFGGTMLSGFLAAAHALLLQIHASTQLGCPVAEHRRTRLN
jgi:hypothetical protein